MEKQAFISYSRKDKTFAARLYEDLEFRGLPVWLDTRDIPAGEVWSREIEQAITACPFFLLLLSPHAVTSEYVRREYRFALAQSLKIIPLLVTPCEIPEDIAHRQYIDMSDYQQGLMRLIRVFPQDAFLQDRSVETLLNALKSSDRDNQSIALSLIAKGNIHEALEAVIAVLQDRDAEIRAMAAHALDKLNDPAAIPALLDALHDPVFDVRSAAGWALVHLGAAAVSPVIQVLRSDSGYNTRFMAYQVLVHIGGKEAGDAVRQYGAEFAP